MSNEIQSDDCLIILCSNAFALEPENLPHLPVESLDFFLAIWLRSLAQGVDESRRRRIAIGRVRGQHLEQDGGHALFGLAQVVEHSR